jgi:hypothetical protein
MKAMVEADNRDQEEIDLTAIRIGLAGDPDALDC